MVVRGDIANYKMKTGLDEKKEKKKTKKETNKKIYGDGIRIVYLRIVKIEINLTLSACVLHQSRILIRNLSLVDIVLILR